MDMVADIVFIVWGVSKTGQDLRRLLNNEYQPVYLPQVRVASAIPIGRHL